MRCWLPVLLLTALLASSSQATVPTYANNGTGNTGTQSSNTVNRYAMTLPNRTGAGNAVVCGYNYATDHGVTANVTDDKGNSYTSFSSSDGGQIVSIARALNVSAGASVVTVTFSGGTPTSVSGGCFEYYNIAASGADDGTCSGNGSGTTVACNAAITTTAGDDLIFQYAIEDGTQNPIDSWTPGASPWTPLILDTYSDQAFQYQAQPAAGSITPSMKLSPSQTWNTIAIALKSASGGTPPPAGIRVNTVYHGLITSTTGSPFSVQFPTTGNLIVAAWIGGPTVDVTGITDSNGNTYTVPAATGNDLSGDIQICHADNATPSLGLKLTVSFARTNSNSTLFLYDISGAAASPLDVRANATGKQSGAGNFNGVTITPTTASGVVISAIGVNISSLNGMPSPAGGFFDTTLPNPIPSTGAVDEDNGWGHFYNTSASPVTFSWSQTLPVDEWASEAVAFKSGTGGSSLTTTSTGLAADHNPATVGQTVTFTATVTGSGGTPTGTVQFEDGTTTLGTAALNGSGVASFATSTLASGTHSITAAYNGDTNFAGSASSVLTETVNAITPSASLSIGSLTFASTPVGATSAAQPVTLTNNGGAVLAVASIAITGVDNTDFSETNNCGTSVSAGGSCTINVVFTPTASGTRTASVTITDNAGNVANSKQSVSLTGNGAVPGATTNTASLTFAGQSIGTASKPQIVMLTNNGGMTLTITSIEITGTNAGDFSQTNSCGTSLAAGTNCAINVTFTPAASGTRTASVTITDDAGNIANSQQSVNLTGSGSVPGASLNITSLTFAGQNIGTMSSPQTVTLTNNGGMTLSIGSIGITGANAGDFSQTNICGTSLAAGTNCAINVSFTPTASGARTASVTITDNAGNIINSQQSISLTGTGTAPAVTLSIASLTFAGQNIGTTSAAQGVRLTNAGTGTLTINGIGTAGLNSGDFSQTNDCGTNVLAGSFCTISVTFTPISAGPRSAAVTINDNASGGPQTIGLTGTGIGSGPSAGLSSTALTFGILPVGTAALAQTVTVTNGGGSTLLNLFIAATGTNSGDFSQTNTCGASLTAGASCSINITFKPTAAGTRTASITITDNASNSPQSVSLTGIGGSPGASLNVASLTFAGQNTGTTIKAQLVTLTNNGSATLSIGSISVTGTNAGDFSQTNTCGTSLASGSNCAINVTFTPTTSGARNASVTITDNAGNISNSQQSVSLSGNSMDFSVSLIGSPSSTIASGQTATYTLQITANGGTANDQLSVGLTCTGAPTNATCSAATSPIVVKSGTHAAATVTINTTANTMMLPVLDGKPMSLIRIPMLLLVLGVLYSFCWASKRSGNPYRRRIGARLAFAAPAMILMLALTTISGCSGLVAQNTKPPVANGTPAGTYSLVVTATSGNLTHVTNLTLVVN